MDSEMRRALMEIQATNVAEAEQQQGMPEVDSAEAVRYMTSRNLTEEEMGESWISCKTNTWSSEVKIMDIAKAIRRKITVVVMRPRKNEKVIQVFEPEHHDSDIYIIHRPGQFNAAVPAGGELTGWELGELNTRGKRCVRRMVKTIMMMRRQRVAAKKVCIWRQRQISSTRERRKEGANSTMEYADWKVRLTKNNGMRDVDFWCSEEAQRTKNAGKEQKDPDDDRMRQTEGQQPGAAASGDKETEVNETEGQQLGATANEDLCTWLEREAEIWRWGQKDRGKVPMKQTEKRGKCINNWMMHGQTLRKLEEAQQRGGEEESNGGDRTRIMAPICDADEDSAMAIIVQMDNRSALSTWPRHMGRDISGSTQSNKGAMACAAR